MMNGDNLEVFYSTPYAGHEGFFEDLLNDWNEDWHEEDSEYLARLAKDCNREEELPELEYPVEFTQVMYDIFQMLRISCLISDRTDILEALKNVFSFEEHEEYQELIQYINATTEEYTEDVY